MGVTLKAVNAALVGLGAKTELAKGAGYFLFRGGEAEEWIDRTVRVPTINSLTLEQWLNEYKRLKTLTGEIMKAAKQGSPAAAKTQRRRQEAPAGGAPARPVRTDAAPPREAAARDSSPKEPCSLKAKLLDDLHEVHKALVAIEEQQVRAAREDRIPDAAALSADAARERNKFDRALIAVRDHTVIHGC
jgi:hypothetical protein